MKKVKIWQQKNWLLSLVMAQALLMNAGEGNEGGGGNPQNPNPQNPPNPPNEQPRNEPPVRVAITADNPEVKQIVKDALDAAEAETKRKAAEEQGNYKQLYEAMKPDYDNLKDTIVPALETKVKELSTTIETGLQTRIDALPEAIKALNPKFADLARQQEWLKTAEEQSAKLGGIQPVQDFTNPINPNPDNSGTSQKVADQKVVEVTRNQGNYHSM